MGEGKVMSSNIIFFKERDEWADIAMFIGNMVAKYADEIDFDSLPEPKEYLRQKEAKQKQLLAEGKICLAKIKECSAINCSDDCEWLLECSRGQSYYLSTTSRMTNH